MASEESEEKSGTNPVLDFLTAGAYKNRPLAEDIANLDRLMTESAASIGEKSGYMSAEEAQAYREQGLAEAETQRKKNLDSVNRLALTNGITNSAALILSAASAACCGAGAVSNHAGKSAAVESGAVRGSQTFIDASRAARWSTRLAEKAADASGMSKLGLGAASGALRAGEGLARSGLLGAGAAAAVTAAPTLMAQIYTRGRTEKMAREFNETIDTLNATLAYHEEKYDELSEDMQESCDQWSEDYEQGSQELLDRYESGELTKAEYDAACEEHVKKSREAAEELDRQYAEEGGFIINGGSAAAAGEELAENSDDPDAVIVRSSTLDRLYEENPESKAQLDTAVETKAKVDSSGSFMDFLATLHAGLVHWLPGVAYVEAAVIKGTDTVMDFLGNTMPVTSSLIDYDAQYEGQSITDMAAKIADTADARWEDQQEASAAVRKLRESQDVPESETETAAEEESETEAESEAEAGAEYVF